MPTFTTLSEAVDDLTGKGYQLGLDPEAEPIRNLKAALRQRLAEPDLVIDQVYCCQATGRPGELLFVFAVSSVACQLKVIITDTVDTGSRITLQEMMDKIKQAFLNQFR